ncbi:hypothetical protein F5050DRAFT_904723 [Lentinula boryana]|uniref:DUF6534 domain-containing protein n=1 Tax=Lentinula boryana TaxID=40481 RepID=A0ABQ8Q1L1_9AGAR|nr:hypothetical protein F5050DRAFT_904723 [Lentinula boryana]
MDSEGLMLTGFMLSAIADTYTSSLAIFLLNTSRTGFQRLDTIINKLIVCVVNTGALSSLAAIACVLLILFARNTLVSLGVFFCISKLYTNSLLANLNIRMIIHKEEPEGHYVNNPDSWPVLLQTNTTRLSNSLTGAYPNHRDRDD